MKESDKYGWCGLGLLTVALYLFFWIVGGLKGIGIATAVVLVMFAVVFFGASVVRHGEGK